MASSLISGLISDGFPKQQLWASDVLTDQLNKLSQQYGIHTMTDNQHAAEQADVIVLALKPQMVAQVVKELSAVIKPQCHLVICLAAGVRLVDLHRWFGADVPIVRCMPNTPALVGSGATALFANTFVSDDQQALAESILRAVGVVVWLNQESDIDLVTALSGSGPAYFFLIMQVLEEAAISHGLDQKIARLLILQTALGAAQLAMQSDLTVTELIQQVTSPNGTTERALQVLEAGKIHQLFEQAFNAAKKRAEEIAELLSQQDRGVN